MLREKIMGAAKNVSVPAQQIAVGTNTTPFITAYPWTSASGFGTKYANPATPIVSQGTVNGLAFTPTGNAIAAAHNKNPYASAYSWSASGFGAKYADPATLPANDCNAVTFSPSGDVIALGHQNTPFIAAYAWTTGGFGTKYANPATLPNGPLLDIAFSPAGNAIAGVHTTAVGQGYIIAYPWTFAGGFGTKYANPATPLDAASRGVAFSPAGNAIVIALDYNTSPIAAYAWTSASGFGTKYANPAVLPVDNCNSIAFSPAGNAVAVTTGLTTPYVQAYAWTSASGFGTRYANPATGNLPASSSSAVEFSIPGNTIAVSSSSSPYITAYPWTSASGFGTKYASPATLPAGGALSVAFAQT